MIDKNTKEKCCDWRTMEECPMHKNSSNVRVQESKDEYYGLWDECLECESTQPVDGNYCSNCGTKFIRK